MVIGGDDEIAGAVHRNLQLGEVRQCERVIAADFQYALDVPFPQPWNAQQRRFAGMIDVYWLDRVVRGLNDAGTEEQAFYVIAFVEFGGEKHHFLGNW
jgi:hypothetical protein